MLCILAQRSVVARHILHCHGDRRQHHHTANRHADCLADVTRSRLHAARLLCIARRQGAGNNIAGIGGNDAHTDANQTHPYRHDHAEIRRAEAEDAQHRAQRADEQRALAHPFRIRVFPDDRQPQRKDHDAQRKRQNEQAGFNTVQSGNYLHEAHGHENTGTVGEEDKRRQIETVTHLRRCEERQRDQRAAGGGFAMALPLQHNRQHDQTKQDEERRRAKAHNGERRVKRRKQTPA